MKQLAEGLDAAHSADVVHGDLKPGNIILVGDCPVIVDFGLAHSRQNVVKPSASFQSVRRVDVLSPKLQLDDANLEATLDITMDLELKRPFETDATVDWIVEQEALGETLEHSNLVISGTPSYMAPEILLNSVKDEKSDIFSLGIIFAELATGKLSLLGETFGQIFKTLKRADVDELVSSEIKEPIKTVVRPMLRHSPHERPTAGEVLELLNQT